jgi:hypothetical protein
MIQEHHGKINKKWAGEAKTLQNWEGIGDGASVHAFGNGGNVTLMTAERGHTQAIEIWTQL